MHEMSSHIPVLLKEVVSGLNLHPGDNVIDGTVGGGGHSEAILEATAPNGRLLAIDWDPEAIKKAKIKLRPKAENRVIYKLGNYTEIKKYVYESGMVNINAIFLDLGLSSDQLQDKSRGFSFAGVGGLDMRYSPETDLTAERIVNQWPGERLIQIFKDYGEERHAARVAKIIIAARNSASIASADQLKELVRRGVGRRGSKIDPATRIFQALRIAVNRELDNLEDFLPLALETVAPGGRVGIISFHSLEDRIVKNFFRREAAGCVCPPEFPKCVCAVLPGVRIITKKPVLPSAEEIKSNPRSRSAKLRIAEKIIN